MGHNRTLQDKFPIIEKNRRVGDYRCQSPFRETIYESKYLITAMTEALFLETARYMENMLREQERQGKRLGVLEERNEVSTLNAAIERMTATMENALAVQKQQNECLETLEKRDGEKWRNVAGYIHFSTFQMLLPCVQRTYIMEYAKNNTFVQSAVKSEHIICSQWR